MKKRVIALLLSILFCSKAEAITLSRNTKFDIYNLGPLIPKGVSGGQGVVSIVGINRLTHRAQLWYSFPDEINSSGIVPHTLAYPRTEIFDGEPLYQNFAAEDISIDQPSTHFLGGMAMIAGTVNIPDEGDRAYWVGIEERDSTSHFVPLGTLGGAWSRALGICKDNIVVGTSTNDRGQPRAFLQRIGTDKGLREISIPETSSTLSSEAVACDPHGNIIGTYQRNPEDATQSFVALFDPLYDRARNIINIPGLGGDGTWANDVITAYTSTGLAHHIIGTAINQLGVSHAFLFNPELNLPGRMTDLGTLSANPNSSSGALSMAINDNNYGAFYHFDTQGQLIVGWSYDPNETHSRAFLYISSEGMMDLNTMLRQSTDAEDWQLIEATAIHKGRQHYIVGKGYYQPSIRIRNSAGGVQRIFWSPPVLSGFILAPNEIEGSKDSVKSELRNIFYRLNRF